MSVYSHASCVSNDILLEATPFLIRACYKNYLASSSGNQHTRKKNDLYPTREKILVESKRHSNYGSES